MSSDDPSGLLPVGPPVDQEPWLSEADGPAFMLGAHYGEPIPDSPSALAQAVATLWKLMPGAVTFELPLERAYEVAGALPAYGTFSPSVLCGLLDQIANREYPEPVPSLIWGWSSMHEVKLEVRLNLTVLDWAAFLLAIGHIGASYETRDPEFGMAEQVHTIRWPRPWVPRPIDEDIPF